MKIRVVETPVYLDFMKAMGAHPVPMPFPELYGALEQGAVDGGTQQITTMVNARLYEVQKYVSLTGHVANPQSLIFSKRLWDTYDVEDQKVLRIAADATRVYARQILSERNAQGIEVLKAKGMQVNELSATELARMKDKAQAVIDKYTRLVGKPLVADLLAARDRAREGK